MSLTTAVEQTRDQFFRTLLEASLPLQEGPDREVALEALIEAVEMLRECFERELDEIRQESD